MVAPLPYYSVGARSGTSARLCLAQSTSFCTWGARLSPDRPRQLSVHLMGNPHPNAATSASARDDGPKRRVCAWLTLQKSCGGNGTEGCIRFSAGHRDAKGSEPHHPAKGLRLPTVTRMLPRGNAKFSGFRHRFIHHFCAKSARKAGFYPPVSHDCLLPLDMHASRWP